MDKKIIIAASAIAVVVIAGVGLWQTAPKISQAINSFDECVAAGDPVMESYPRQCRANGKTFVEVIDETPTVPETVGTNPPNSAEGAPPGSIHNLPVPQAVSKTKTYAARQFGVTEGEVLILTAFEKEWSDACLGVSKEDTMCAQVITPGWEITVMVKGQEVEYHTNATGSSIVEAN